MALGDRLRIRRCEKGYSQKEFAEKLNISSSAVSHFENGSNYPKITLLIDMMHLLQCDANYLFQDYMDSSMIGIQNMNKRHLVTKFRTISEHDRMLIENLIEASYECVKEEREKLISRDFYSPIFYEGMYFYLGKARRIWINATEKNQKADFCLQMANRSDIMADKPGHILLLKDAPVHHNEVGLFQIDKGTCLAKMFVYNGKVQIKPKDGNPITISRGMKFISRGKVVGKLEGGYYL